MIRIFILALILIVSVILGPILAGHQGYVLIQTKTYNLETSVTSLVIMILIGWVILHILARLLRHIINGGGYTRGWLLGRKRFNAKKQSAIGLLKFIEGNNDAAYKLLSEYAPQVDMPVLNYLIAAEAALRQGEFSLTEQFLKKANSKESQTQLAKGLIAGRLALAQGDSRKAAKIARQLVIKNPRHQGTLELAMRSYLADENYRGLIALIPQMSKLKSYQQYDIHSLQHQAYTGLMDQIVHIEGIDGLKSWWLGLPRRISQQPLLQIPMMQHLVNANESDRARQILNESLKYRMDERLLVAVPDLAKEGISSWEKIISQYINQENNSELALSSLAQLQMKQNKWSDAKETLQKSLSISATAKNYTLLADVLEQLHQREEAALMRQKGLSLTLND